MLLHTYSCSLQKRGVAERKAPNKPRCSVFTKRLPGYAGYPNPNEPYGALGDASSDNYYATPTFLSATASLASQSVYTWATIFFQGATDNDWNDSYQQVLYATWYWMVSIIYLFTADSQESWNNIKGQALFFRGIRFLQPCNLIRSFL